MGNDINSLLSTFKTNMMNNGVTVESSDKFKTLIDKIATMVEEGQGKGIQFVEDVINGTMPNLTWNNGSYSSVLNITFSEILDFTPTLFLVSFSNFSPVYTNNNNFFRSSNIVLDSSLSPFDLNLSNLAFKLYIENVNNSGFTVRVHIAGSTGLMDLGMTVNKFYAIGVGEEDTTLRESLASILENKGVDVTEEDDMASLITKVDSINSGGLDIISAAELPATGKENQICVVTDNPVDNFVITPNYADKNTNTGGITLYIGNTSSMNTSLGAAYSTQNNGITTNYYFNRVCQGDARLGSYIYQNSQWNSLTVPSVVLMENQIYHNTDSLGVLYTGARVSYDTTSGLLFTPSYNADQNTKSIGITTQVLIDFSGINTIKLKACKHFSTGTTGFVQICACRNAKYYTNSAASYVRNSTGLSSVYNSTDMNIAHEPSTTNYVPREIVFDVSSWTGTYYFGIIVTCSGYENIRITDIEFI